MSFLYFFISSNGKMKLFRYWSKGLIGGFKKKCSKKCHLLHLTYSIMEFLS